METQLKKCGLHDILVACVDGLKVFPDAIAVPYPKTDVQMCVVHMVRNALRYVSWKERKVAAHGLRSMYTAPTTEAAGMALEACARKWDTRRLPDPGLGAKGPVQGDPQGLGAIEPRVKDWNAALNHFAIVFEERVPR